MVMMMLSYLILKKEDCGMRLHTSRKTNLSLKELFFIIFCIN